MNPRRWSFALSIVGGGLLVAAATLLVSISLGSTATSTGDSTGRVVTAEFSNPSIMQNSPWTAFGWIAAALALAVVVALLIRYGGVLGPALVLVVMPLSVLASILTIGIFLAPGAACVCVAALLAIINRENGRDPDRTVGAHTSSGP